ncbi:hypothetical protein LG324_15675 [Phycicoccus jejuensis]|uniref:hypothetical protein n=1 Tax=Phycicoccus jejuensis TaxID=367299 RepID=UPI00384B4211
MSASITSVLSMLLVVAHLVPPLVGLVLVARRRTRASWRTFALLSFGIGLVSGVSQAAITGSFWFGGTWGMEVYPVLSLLQTALGLVSLVGSALGVAAVLADRRDDEPAPPAASAPGPYPQG